MSSNGTRFRKQPRPLNRSPHYEIICVLNRKYIDHPGRQSLHMPSAPGAAAKAGVLPQICVLTGPPIAGQNNTTGGMLHAEFKEGSSTLFLTLPKYGACAGDAILDASSRRRACRCRHPSSADLRCRGVMVTPASSMSLSLVSWS